MSCVRLGLDESPDRDDEVSDFANDSHTAIGAEVGTCGETGETLANATSMPSTSPMVPDQAQRRVRQALRAW